ncbi:MAG: hypothetical protein IJX66_06810 [Lachnospiraceae bacterium]|nr:hypothetical protein [Lachnospiraceae bacterium]
MKKRGYIIFSAIFFFCSLFTIAGVQLEKQGNLIWTGSFVAKLLFGSLLIGLVGGVGITTLFLAFEKRKKEAEATQGKEPMNRRWVFVMSCLGSFLVWLPVFLAFYPGNCTYDIGGQTWYIVSGNYEAHHPIAHTLLMELFVNVGIWLGSVNFGMALYVLFQMACLASAFAFGITLFYSMNMNKKWLIALQIWAMFFIPNWYLSISTTKDIIFSAAVLVMLLCLYRILLQKRNELRVDGWDIGFWITGVLMILFRNNGKYALLVTFVFSVVIILFARQNRKMFIRIGMGCACILVVGSLALSALSYLTKASDIRKEEMLSVPIQQLSRVMNYQKEIDEDDKEVIDGFIINAAYENYIPSIADPVKSSVDISYISGNLKGFVNTYFGLLAQYPGDFINAVLALDAGYLNPFDMTHKDVYAWGASWLRVGWSPQEELGLTQTPVFENLNKVLRDFADDNKYIDIPVLGYFVMPGGYLWMYVLLAGWLLWKKKYSYLFLLSYMAGYYVTLLLGPTVQLRYIYTVMITLPFVFVGIVAKKDWH